MQNKIEVDINEVVNELGDKIKQLETENAILKVQLKKYQSKDKFSKEQG